VTLTTEKKTLSRTPKYLINMAYPKMTQNSLFFLTKKHFS